MRYYPKTPMGRYATAFVVAVILATAIYLNFAVPTSTFVLLTRDGVSTLTYLCTTENGEAEAQARAAKAHVFFEDQLAIVSDAAAKGMQDAMEAATAAGTTPDFSAIEAVRADLMAATVAVVQDMYGCTVSEPPVPA